MTAQLQSLGIDRMTITERLALLDAIWDSLSAEIEQSPLTPAQQAEVDRRLAAHAADPGAAVPWQEVEAKALARLRK